jgi:two-component system, NtrC family, sensor histidine kinase KinB
MNLMRLVRLVRSLRGRLIIVGGLLVLAVIASTSWSTAYFALLTAQVDTSLRANEKLLTRSAALSSALEREDDALLLALAGSPDAQAQVLLERERVDSALAQLGRLAIGDPQASLITALQQDIIEYRNDASVLLTHAGKPAALEFYYREVNPALRDSLAVGERLRELAYIAMQSTGVTARDGARYATVVVLLIALGSLIVAVLAAMYLTRTILQPIRSLTDSAIALREGEFQHQVPIASADELGQLAREFNDMADSIAAFRRANLGELLRVKRLLEASLQSLPDGVILVRQDGEIESINPVARKLLRLTPDAGPASLTELGLPDEVLSSVVRDFGSVKSAGAMAHSSTSTFLTGGAVLQVTATALEEAGTIPSGFLVVLRDVTKGQRVAS